MNKASLRKQFTEKRSRLSDSEYERFNLQLLQQFKTLDLSEVKYVHIFLPILKRKEPNTLLIIDWLKEHHSQIILVYPKCNFEDCSMNSYTDDANLKLADNAFGITEPIKGNTIEPSKINMIILPLLAFDKRGYRVGYGKGFYDRFIARCRDDVQLVGLSFFDPVDEISDTNQYDKRIQKCITPKKVWAF